MSRAGRRGSVAGIALALGLVAAGCGFPSNTPTEYDDVTRDNFIEGCTENYVVGGTTSTLGTGQDASVCECAYDWMVANIPFDEEAAAAAGKPAEPNFVQLDKALADDPNAVPAEVQQALSEACDGFGGTAQQPSPGPVAPTTDTSEAQ